MKVIKNCPSGFASNSYVLFDELSGQAAVIDPSISWQTALKGFGSDLPQVKYILLTHGHFDHMLCLAEWRERFGAAVCIHKEDAPCLTDPKKSYFLKFAGKNTTFDPPDVNISEGEVFYLGDNKITVMHTPGHTRGSVCYIAGDYFFSGDTLLCGDIGRCDLYGGDFQEMQNSLAKISNLTRNYTIYPGHGENTTLKAELKYNRYFCL
ncbi:MAG: MBL fold metallo-hydrolase [Clostridiales bacterium]|nr:MBL fold metallo-hydrolase [Clostridiales bacterium]